MTNNTAHGTEEYNNEEEDEGEEALDKNVHVENVPRRIHRRNQSRVAERNGLVRKAVETGGQGTLNSILNTLFKSGSAPNVPAGHRILSDIGVRESSVQYFEPHKTGGRSPAPPTNANGLEGICTATTTDSLNPKTNTQKSAA